MKTYADTTMAKLISADLTNNKLCILEYTTTDGQMIAQGALVTAPEGDLHHLAERRIECILAVAGFHLGKARKIVVECEVHHRLVRVLRLDKHATRTPGTARSPRRLAQQLEQPLRTASFASITE